MSVSSTPIAASMAVETAAPLKPLPRPAAASTIRRAQYKKSTHGEVRRREAEYKLIATVSVDSCSVCLYIIYLPHVSTL